MKAAVSWLLNLLLGLSICVQAAPAPVRVGVLQFGTLNWEMAVIERHGLDRLQDVQLQVLPFSSKNAVNVALQGRAVDLIVGDWLWVNHQRAAGKDYRFFPYSLTVGGLYVRPDAAIESLQDLAGQRLGVAGGPVDKSWVLLRAYGHSLGINLAEQLEPTFAAPPLLNRLMLRGDLPALLNYWHYGARLQAKGMRTLVDVQSMLQGLGVTEPVPMLGWVFSDAWAQRNPKAVRGFLRASYRAKQRLEWDDEEWLHIRHLTKAEDDTTLLLLRDGYRRGIPVGLVANGEGVARRLFNTLAREGGVRLVGKAQGLLPGTFWKGLDSAELFGSDATR